MSSEQRRGVITVIHKQGKDPVFFFKKNFLDQSHYLTNTNRCRGHNRLKLVLPQLLVSARPASRPDEEQIRRRISKRHSTGWSGFFALLSTQV